MGDSSILMECMMTLRNLCVQLETAQRLGRVPGHTTTVNLSALRASGTHTRPSAVACLEGHLDAWHPRAAAGCTSGEER